MKINNTDGNHLVFVRFDHDIVYSFANDNYAAAMREAWQFIDGLAYDYGEAYARTSWRKGHSKGETTSTTWLDHPTSRPRIEADAWQRRLAEINASLKD